LKPVISRMSWAVRSFGVRRTDEIVGQVAPLLAAADVRNVEAEEGVLDVAFDRRDLFQRLGGDLLPGAGVGDDQIDVAFPGWPGVAAGVAEDVPCAALWVVVVEDRQHALAFGGRARRCRG
jgi:hypothetical protein